MEQTGQMSLPRSIMDNLEKLAPKQIHYMQNANKRINISEGSVRSGKTVSANLKWIEYVLNSGPPGEYLMFGKTERTLRRNILTPLQGLLGNSLRINQGQGEAYLKDKLIYFAGASDERAVQKIQGLTLAGAYGDELALAPESFFAMLLSRLSVPRAKFFGTTNPEGPYHWLKTDYIDRVNELDMAVFHFNIDDNLSLGKVYITNLKKEYTGVFYKRYIDGLWALAEGIIYDVFNPDVHVDTIVGSDDFQNYIVGIDYGTNNPCTFGLYGFDGGLPVYLVKEYWYDGSKDNVKQKTDGQYADDLEDFLGNIKPDVVYVDPSALSFITELKQRKLYNIKGANNDVLSGIKFISKLLSEEKYFVDKSCAETIKGYQSYVWDTKAQQRGEDKPLKVSDHVCDRDRYALYSHFFKRYFPSGQKYYK